MIRQESQDPWRRQPRSRRRTRASEGALATSNPSGNDEQGLGNQHAGHEKAGGTPADLIVLDNEGHDGGYDGEVGGIEKIEKQDYPCYDESISALLWVQLISNGGAPFVLSAVGGDYLRRVGWSLSFRRTPEGEGEGRFETNPYGLGSQHRINHLRNRRGKGGSRPAPTRWDASSPPASGQSLTFGMSCNFKFVIW